LKEGFLCVWRPLDAVGHKAFFSARPAFRQQRLFFELIDAKRPCLITLADADANNSTLLPAPTMLGSALNFPAHDHLDDRPPKRPRNAEPPPPAMDNNLNKHRRLSCKVVSRKTLYSILTRRQCTKECRRYVINPFRLVANSFPPG
jgi:hypothetical protein